MEEKRYICIKDYQGDTFGMFRDCTAKQWLEQAREWADSDGNDTTCWCINNYPNEQAIIYDISDWWQIKIVELKNTEEVVKYLKDIKNTYSNYIYDWASKLLKELEVN